MKKLSLFFILVLNISLSAQQVQKPINSSEILKKYQDLYQEEKYDEALVQLQKIDKNDTSYVEALIGTSIVYIKQKKYDEAILACKKGLALNAPVEYKFYINMAVALNRSEKYQEAIKVLDQALLKYPRNYLMHYNKGACYLADKNIPKAIEFFKKAIRLNPYHASSHLELALIAANEGKVSQAMLAMNMFLTLEPATTRSFEVLQQFNEMVSSKYSQKPSGANLSPEGGDDFSELDLIITNYAALAKGYKVPVKTELPIVKQNYALFSKLTYDKEDKGFWTQTYVPFFKELYTQNQFPGFSYYSLQSSENAQHKELIKKNMPLIDKFVAWAGPYVDKTTAMYIDTVNGKKQVYKHWFDSETHTLYKVGTLAAGTETLTGTGEYYYTNGSLRSRGNYNAQGKREGTWSFYYENGGKEQEAVYKDGRLEGKLLYFNEEGNLIAELTYVNDQISGEKKIYNGSGFVTDRNYYKDGSIEGIQLDFQAWGEPSKKSVVKYLHNELIDTIYVYYDNGTLKSTELYSNKNYNGDYTIYYKNGIIDTKGKYINGQKEGEYKEYFDNGQLYMEGNYLKGNETGKRSTYNRNGKLVEESIYDDKGKRNGTYKSYDVDGKLICEMEYANGAVNAYKYFDKQGKVIKEGKRQKGEFDFIGYYPEGNKKFEGIYTTQGKKGIWKYYDSYGNLSSEEEFNEKGLLEGTVKKYSFGILSSTLHYANNKLDGPFYEYFNNGKIKSEGWYSDGLAAGYFYYYYIDGTLESKAYYLKDVLNGTKEYYAVTGKIEKEELYKSDCLRKIVLYDSLKNITNSTEFKSGTGNYVVNYPNGKMKFSGNYLEGFSHGKYTWYHSNGNVHTEGSFFNNNKNGDWKWYYEDKKIEKEGAYYFGKLDGKWKYYYPSGKLKKVEYYENGMKTGDVISYYENEKIELKKTFINDEEEGEGFYYGMTGELQIKRFFKTGNVVAYTYPDVNGQMVAPINIVSGDYKVLSYYKNGNKSREYTVEKGALRDVYTEYHFNGQVSESKPYKSDELMGINKEFYEDGKIKLEENYIYDYQEGLSKYYFPNGKIEKELNYKLGVLHGEAKYYNNTGKLIKKEFYYSGDLLKEETF